MSKSQFSLIIDHELAPGYDLKHSARCNEVTAFVIGDVSEYSFFQGRVYIVTSSVSLFDRFTQLLTYLVFCLTVKDGKETIVDLGH